MKIIHTRSNDKISYEIHRIVERFCWKISSETTKKINDCFHLSGFFFNEELALLYMLIDSD